MNAGDTTDRRVLCFDDYELNCATSELIKAGKKLKLQPQPAKVLAMLASRAGSLVMRDELRQTVWGADTALDFERALNFCIRKVRSVLDDEAEQPRYVETLPKRGYRFLAEVRVKESSPPAIDSLASAPSFKALILPVSLVIGVAICLTAFFLSPRSLTGNEQSITVLPFVDISAAGSNSDLSDGMAKELYDRLSSEPRLRVTGRLSASAVASIKDFRQAARTLQVRYLLTGSVKKTGGRVIVSSEVVDPEHGSTLWSGSFDRPIADVSELQDEIADAVARALQVRSEGSPSIGKEKFHLRSPQLYATYLQAVRIGERVTMDSFEQSVGLLQSIIEREPSYAPAHARLAHVYLRAGIQGLMSPEELRNRARPLAERAIALDPDSPEALTVIGTLALSEFHWNTAEQTFRRAIRLSPNYSEAHEQLAYVLLYRGNTDESFLEAERAWQLEPLSSSVTRSRGNILFYGRRYAEAIRVLESARALDPAFAWNHYSLARAYLQTGDCDKATSAAAEHSRLVGAPSTIRSLVLSRCGTADEARAALAGIRPSASTAAVHAMLGDNEAALRILEKSIDVTFGPSLVLSVNPEFDGLRSEPRFSALLKRLRLAD